MHDSNELLLSLENIAQLSSGQKLARLSAVESQIKSNTLNAFVRQYSLEFDSNLEHILSGVAVCAKDVFAVKDSPLSFGMSPPFVSRADTNADALTILCSLGARCVGATNLDELGLYCTGHNRNFGTIKNPVRANRSVLGSSGGTAAAVAAGLSDIGLGSDFGGSARGPAAACDICSILPGSAWHDGSGVLSVTPTLDRVGIMARQAEDLLYLSASLPSMPNASADWSPSFICLDSPHSFLSAEVHQSYTSFYQTLNDIIKIEPCHLMELYAECCEVRNVIASSEFHEFALTHDLDLKMLPDIGNAMFAFGRSLPAEQRAEALQKRTEITEQMRTALNSSVLISPVVPSFPEPSPVAIPDTLGLFLAPANVCSLSAAVLSMDWGQAQLYALSDEVLLAGIAFVCSLTDHK